MKYRLATAPARGPGPDVHLLSSPVSFSYTPMYSFVTLLLSLIFFLLCPPTSLLPCNSFLPIFFISLSLHLRLVSDNFTTITLPRSNSILSSLLFRICSKPASHIAWGDVEPWRVLGSKAPPDCFAESSCPQIVTFCAHVRLRCRDIHTLYYAIHPSSFLVRDLRLDIFFRFLVLLWGDTQSCPSARNQASVFVNYLQAQGFNFFLPIFYASYRRACSRLSGAAHTLARAQAKDPLGPSRPI